MNLGINIRNEELILVVKVSTTSPVKIRIKVFDADFPKTVFTNRYKTVKSTESFYIRMPLAPKKIVLSIYNEHKGNLKKGEDDSFKVESVTKLPLEKRTDVVDITDKKVRNFVDFAQRFSFNASYLEDNKIYQSKHGGFLIEYLPFIKKTSTNKRLKTPARISKVNGRIQVSKADFENYTVPMRMAILLHEFSHFYLNEDMTDETEADLNALLIYLALGYPRIEGYQAFLEVFKSTPTQSNKERYDIIDEFIRNFEKKKMVI
jgi:hypothetical protein